MVAKWRIKGAERSRKVSRSGLKGAQEPKGTKQEQKGVEKDSMKCMGKKEHKGAEIIRKEKNESERSRKNQKGAERIRKEHKESERSRKTQKDMKDASFNAWDRQVGASKIMWKKERSVTKKG